MVKVGFMSNTMETLWPLRTWGKVSKCTDLIYATWVCVCTMIKSSSSGTGEAGLISPSEWSDEAFLFLFFAPTSVIVLEVEKKNKSQNKCLAN